MHRLWSYIYRYRYRYLRGILCLATTATLAMSTPYLLKRAVEGIEQGIALHSFSFLVLAIIGIALVQRVTRAFSRFLIFNAGRDIEYELRNELFAHLETLSLSYHAGQIPHAVVRESPKVALLSALTGYGDHGVAGQRGKKPAGDPTGANPAGRRGVPPDRLPPPVGREGGGT